MMLKQLALTTTISSLILGAAGFTALSLSNPAQADTQMAQSPNPVGNCQGRGPRSDRLEQAAAELGVTEAALKAALGLPAQRPRLDVAAAATQLGIAEADLRAALRDSRQGPGRRGGPPDLAAVAQQFNVTETELRLALGLPPEPISRPDLATAAAQLGVTEAALRQALDSAFGPGRGPGPGPR